MVEAMCPLGVWVRVPPWHEKRAAKALAFVPQFFIQPTMDNMVDIEFKPIHDHSCITLAC